MGMPRDRPSRRDHQQAATSFGDQLGPGILGSFQTDVGWCRSQTSPERKIEAIKIRAYPNDASSRQVSRCVWVQKACPCSRIFRSCRAWAWIGRRNLAWVARRSWAWASSRDRLFSQRRGRSSDRAWPGWGGTRRRLLPAASKGEKPLLREGRRSQRRKSDRRASRISSPGTRTCLRVCCSALRRRRGACHCLW